MTTEKNPPAEESETLGPPLSVRLSREFHDRVVAIAAHEKRAVATAARLLLEAAVALKTANPTMPLHDVVALAGVKLDNRGGPPKPSAAHRVPLR